MTTIAIIGLGKMGRGLAARLEGKADLVLGTRDIAAATDLGMTYGAVVVGYEDAARAADIVVLAIPYAAALEFAASPALVGKVVVDMSNPVNADYSGLVLGHSTSAAEEIQKAGPKTRVVKAFNTIFAELFTAPEAATAGVPVFVAGNDAAAVEAVAGLVRLAGFATETAGGLDASRLIEPVGMLNIRLGYGLGRGTQIAPAWLKIAA